MGTVSVPSIVERAQDTASSSIRAQLGATSSDSVTVRASASSAQVGYRALEMAETAIADALRGLNGPSEFGATFKDTIRAAILLQCGEIAEQQQQQRAKRAEEQEKDGPSEKRAASVADPSLEPESSQYGFGSGPRLKEAPQVSQDQERVKRRETFAL